MKEEEAAEVMVPKRVARPVGDSQSDMPVPLRRINLAAGRLLGKNADGTWLAGPSGEKISSAMRCGMR
jgi:hypothetical protein